MNYRANITFLDNDHIMTLMRLMLKKSTFEDDRWLKAFFAPEPVDLSALRQMGSGLREIDGVGVHLDDGTSTFRDTDILVFRRGNIGRQELEHCPSLKLVQRLGASPDPIDLAAAAEKRISVSCLERKSLAYTAEHALLLMLALSKKLVVADASVRTGRFDPHAIDPVDNVSYNWVGLSGLGGLFGKTLGIIGLGEVGYLVAERARAFGMNVCYSNLVQLPPEREAALGVEYCSLDRLLEASDIVSLHVPSTKDNIKMIGVAAFSRMRKNALFINMSRGRLVDEDALYDALSSGRIAGAGLDVHVEEPRLPDDRFCKLDKVILTPHIGGGSRLGVLDEIAQIFDNMRAALSGNAPRHGVVLASERRKCA